MKGEHMDEASRCFEERYRNSPAVAAMEHCLSRSPVTDALRICRERAQLLVDPLTKRTFRHQLPNRGLAKPECFGLRCPVMRLDCVYEISQPIP